VVIDSKSTVAVDGGMQEKAAALNNQTGTKIVANADIQAANVATPVMQTESSVPSGAIKDTANVVIDKTVIDSKSTLAVDGGTQQNAAATQNDSGGTTSVKITSTIDKLSATPAAVCGNGIVETGEGCDPPNAPAKNCRIGYCGANCQCAAPSVAK
jgi:hypothetical protein